MTTATRRTFATAVWEGAAVAPMLAMVTVLVVGTVCPESFAATADETSHCNVANTLLASGFADEALEAYRGVLQDTEITIPAKQCAIDALPKLRQVLAAKHLAKALVYRARGDNEGAITALDAALDIDPTSKETLDQLRALSASTRSDNKRIARAEQLVDLGRTDEARELITEYLISTDNGFSGHMDLTPKLDALFGGSNEPWRDLRRYAPIAIQPYAEMAGSMLAVLVLGVLLVRRWRSGPTVKITDFDGGGFEEEHLSRVFSHSLHSKLDKLRSGERAGDLSLVTGPLETIDLPSEVQAVIPQAPAGWLSPLTWVRALPALLDWITQRRVIHVTGSLRAPGKRGVGVTVNLVEANQILSAYTFWQHNFDGEENLNTEDVDENLYRISEYVAVWLMYEIRERIGDRALQLLGTRDWKSYALFRAGLFAEDDYRELAAKSLYTRALQRDTGFRGARTNLGLWYIRHRELPRATRLLKRAVNEGAGEPHADRDASLYIARYNLAVIEDEQGKTDAAKANIEELVALIDAALKKIDARKDGYSDATLKRNLDEIRPAAIAMEAGIRVREKDEAALALLDNLSASAKLGHKEHYNLACSFSLAAAYAPTHPSGEREKKPDTYLDKSLEHLRRAFELFPRAADQAWDDPTLEELRERRADEFDGLSTEFGALNGADVPDIAEEPSPALSELASVGQKNAERLAELGIVSSERLLQKVVSLEGRRQLANDLGMSVRVVTRWAEAADLTRVVGLGIPEVNLLALCRVHTINELAACEPKALAEDLAVMSNAQNVEAVPDEITVTRWIAEASATTKPLVVAG